MGIKENIISLFFGRCDIYEMENAVDERGVTGQVSMLKQSDVECRLVFGGSEGFAAYRSASENTHKNDLRMNVRVFLSPDTDIKAGSILVVRQNGSEYRLRSTSEGALYRHHREVLAVPYESEV